MSTVPFIRRRRRTTDERTAGTRPPAPPRPTLRQAPVEQHPVTEPASDPTLPAPTGAPSAAPIAAPTVVQNVTAGSSARRPTADYIAPDAVITSVVGGLMLALGLVAVAKLGLRGSVLLPVEDVLGVPHTPLLGLVEIGVGLLLAILGVLAARGASIVVGAVVAVVGAIVVIAVEDLDADLALTREIGWWAVGAGAVVVLANLLLPSVAVRSDR